MIKRRLVTIAVERSDRRSVRSSPDPDLILRVECYLRSVAGVSSSVSVAAGYRDATQAEGTIVVVSVGVAYENRV